MKKPNSCDYCGDKIQDTFCVIYEGTKSWISCVPCFRILGKTLQDGHKWYYLYPERKEPTLLSQKTNSFMWECKECETVNFTASKEKPVRCTCGAYGSFKLLRKRTS